MINRRQLLAATTTGAVFGLTVRAMTDSYASLRFIGRRSTIITLLDTGSERILIVIGEQDTDLLANIPGLTTIGNTRIDMVVATHRVLASRTGREHLQLENTPAIAIQAHSSLPPIRGDIAVATYPVGLKPGDHTRLHITPSLGGASEDNADHPDYVIDIVYQHTRIVLASSDSALRIMDGGNCEALVVPGAPGPIATSRLQPALLISTAVRPENIIAPYVQAFPSDPMVARFESNGITVREDQLSS